MHLQHLSHISLLAGEFDRIATRSAVESLAQFLPYSSFASVPDCGHLSHEETPAALLAAMTEFFREVMQQQQQQ